MSSNSPAAPRVLLVHGLLNTRWWLWPWAQHLRQAGFEVELFGYNSFWGGPEQALPILRKHLMSGRYEAVIGHSLGGLLAVEAAREVPEDCVRRIVCMGSPLNGSHVARTLHALPWGGHVLGKSADLLTQGVSQWNRPIELGVVAGNLPRGMGRLLARIEEVSDGTVALTETQLPGIACHCCVSASHTGLVFSKQAIGQAAHFLKYGHFQS